VTPDADRLGAIDQAIADLEAQIGDLEGEIEDARHELDTLEREKATIRAARSRFFEAATGRPWSEVPYNRLRELARPCAFKPPAPAADRLASKA
jgi:hypothetical protein